jgi:menaquinone-dependent protoporphyrinogen oxidase
LILYMSHHGTTEKIANQLANALGRESSTIINLGKMPSPELKPFDTVLIGGSIHAGQIQKKIKDFCITHAGELLTKRLGLYMCSMSTDKAETDLKNAFPDSLLIHASAKGVFGGELLFDKMNFFERIIVRSKSGAKGNVYNLKQEAIQSFIDCFRNPVQQILSKQELANQPSVETELSKWD